jgi:hypothetical protein
LAHNENYPGQEEFVFAAASICNEDRTARENPYHNSSRLFAIIELTE